MPLTAFGLYELAVTQKTAKCEAEQAVQTFFYFPVLRLVGFVVLLGLFVFLCKRPWRSRKWPSVRWIGFPLYAALLSYLFLPAGSALQGVIAPSLIGQMCGLSLTLWTICRFRKRRRTLAAVLALLINTLAVLASYMAGLGVEWWIMMLVPASLLATSWTAPSLLALIAVRKFYTWKRLSLGLLISLSMSSAVACTLVYLTMGDGLHETALFFFLLPIPYLLGFSLFAVKNSWCRKGILRSFGVGTNNDDR